MVYNTAGTVQSYIEYICYIVVVVEIKKSTPVHSVADTSSISEYLTCILQEILSLASSTVAALE